MRDNLANGEANAAGLDPLAIGHGVKMRAVHRVRQVHHVAIAVRSRLRLAALLVPHQEVALSSKGQRRKTCALGPACFAVAMIADTILTVLVFFEQYGVERCASCR